jgi:hypothetical protein
MLNGNCATAATGHCLTLAKPQTSEFCTSSHKILKQKSLKIPGGLTLTIQTQNIAGTAENKLGTFKLSSNKRTLPFTSSM